MKFLVDAHIPKKLSLYLEWKGFDSLHTLDLPEKNRTTDSEINRISVDEKRVLITKDSDFIESIFVSDKPYKLIYVSTGNISNQELLKLFTENLNLIVDMIEENRLIELSNEELIIRS